MSKIALVMGHTIYGKGTGATSGIWNESLLTRRVGQKMIDYIKSHDNLINEYDVIATDLSMDYIQEQATYLNAVGYDYAFHFHFNSFKEADVNGTEVFEWEKSFLGDRLSFMISDLLETKNRGAKTDKTYKFLRLTKMKAFIVEPVFITNDNDMAKYDFLQNEYIDTIFKFCEEQL